MWPWGTGAGGELGKPVSHPGFCSAAGREACQRRRAKGVPAAGGAAAGTGFDAAWRYPAVVGRPRGERGLSLIHI
ncbi:MAG: hypothetical protein N2383_06050, partial [Caldilineales bacterium]|nr:hypothetical protein [Caldilineales bacterium]